MPHARNRAAPRSVILYSGDRADDAVAAHHEARRLLPGVRQPRRHRCFAGRPDGLFNCDTRYLSHFELLINELQPLLLGSNLSDDNCVLSVDLTNPDIYYDKRILLQKNLLHVARTVFVWRSTLFHRFAVP